MQVDGPDGTPHDFPDDATNDEILNFFGQSAAPKPGQGPGSGTGVIPGTPEAAAQVAANTASRLTGQAVPDSMEAFFTPSGSILGISLRAYITRKDMEAQ